MMSSPSALGHAAILGVGTAAMGTAYARCLKTSVSTVWLCTSLVWTWSGGRDLWTYLDVPLPVAVLSSAAWLGTAHAATPEIRTKAVAVLHRLVGRGIPHSA